MKVILQKIGNVLIIFILLIILDKYKLNNM